MTKKEHIVKYTNKELETMPSQSDWSAASVMTKTQIEAAIAEDIDEANMLVDWSQATIELPKPKSVLNIRVDSDVLDFFRNQGKGYQTKINAVLRSYVEQILHSHAN